jgi:hypothetical protein
VVYGPLALVSLDEHAHPQLLLLMAANLHAFNRDVVLGGARASCGGSGSGSGSDDDGACDALGIGASGGAAGAAGAAAGAGAAGPSGQVTAAGPGAVNGADPAAEAGEADGEGCGEYQARHQAAAVVHYDAREGGPKVLAEVLEALLAAVFLDSGCDMVLPAAGVRAAGAAVAAVTRWGQHADLGVGGWAVGIESAHLQPTCSSRQVVCQSLKDSS